MCIRSIELPQRTSIYSLVPLANRGDYERVICPLPRPACNIGGGHRLGLTYIMISTSNRYIASLSTPPSLTPSLHTIHIISPMISHTLLLPLLLGSCTAISTAVQEGRRQAERCCRRSNVPQQCMFYCQRAHMEAVFNDDMGNGEAMDDLDKSGWPPPPPR